MGRRDDKIDPDFCGTVKIAHLPMVDWCYDQGGAYWGSGTPLWAMCWEDDDVVNYAYFRVRSYSAACEHVREEMPDATCVRAVNVVSRSITV